MTGDAIEMDGRLRRGGDGLASAFLPSPAVQNHAANLALLPDGTLCCVWFGGTMEGSRDISILLSRFDRTAGCWTPAERLSDDPDRSEQNPLLFTAPDGAVWLLHTAQRAGHQNTAFVRRRVSTDGGASFGPAETFLDVPGTFVRQPVATTAEGTLLLPVFRCRALPGAVWRGDADDSAVLVSRDGGASWGEVAVPGSTGCVHMNIVDLGGELLAAFRSRYADAVHFARSADGGETWSRPAPGSLPNNNSSIQMTKLASGRLAMVYNHAAATAATAVRASLYDEIEDDGGRGTDRAAEAEAGSGRAAIWGTPRAPLSIALSEDGGRTWPRRRDLATGEGYCLSNNSADGLNREFSYPSILEDADGVLHVAYTHHRRAIRHVMLREEDIG